MQQRVAMGLVGGLAVLVSLKLLTNRKRIENRQSNQSRVPILDDSIRNRVNLNRVVLLTGASSGIGKGLAEKLVEEGYSVIGVARDLNKLKEVANEINQKNFNGVMVPLSADVTNPKSRAELLVTIQRVFPSLTYFNLLVLCAGTFAWDDNPEISAEYLLNVNSHSKKEMISEFKEYLNNEISEEDSKKTKSIIAIIGSIRGKKGFKEEIEKVQGVGAVDREKNYISSMQDIHNWLGNDTHYLGYNVFLFEPSTTDTPLARRELSGIPINWDNIPKVEEFSQLFWKRVSGLEEKEKLEKEKLEKEKLEKERLEKERLEKERLEKERLEKERLEKERLEKEKLEKERLEKERLEKERLEKEKLEKEKLEKEKLEKEKLEKEKLEKEKLEKERLEKERLEKEKLEKERLEKEKLEKEKLEKERLEKERLEKEKLEKEKIEKEKLEKEKLEKEKLEKERLEKEKLEKERLEQERLEKEKLEKEKLEQEKEQTSTKPSSTQTEGEKKTLFWSIEFSEETSKKFLSHPNVVKILEKNPTFKLNASFHVTLGFFGGQENLSKELLEVEEKYKQLEGTTMKVLIQSVHYDSKCIALKVKKDFLCSNINPHITVALASGTQAVYSNTLLASDNQKFLECEMEIEGEVFRNLVVGGSGKKKQSKKTEKANNNENNNNSNNNNINENVVVGNTTESTVISNTNENNNDNSNNNTNTTENDENEDESNTNTGNGDNGNTKEETKKSKKKGKSKMVLKKGK